jgi:hypothetical protein
MEVTTLTPSFNYWKEKIVLGSLSKIYEMEMKLGEAARKRLKD